MYSRKKADQVSWFRPHLEQSLSYVRRAALTPASSIIDVGAGASTFVDDLLDAGYSSLTAVDLSETALGIARARLGQRGDAVKWLVGDITDLRLPEQAFDFWHDRAVFHFLRQPEQRALYVDAVRHALKPGGHIVVATFGPHGPVRCSDLDAMRYSADQLHSEFGSGFQKVHELVELHPTPSGKEQEFVYCLCRRE